MSVVANSPIFPDLSELIALRAEANALLLPAKLRVATEHTGQYASLQQGRGMEFEEVRGYQPGDDIRSVDWRVTARRGTPHTKIFREERERPILFLTDMGDTMRFATRVAFKSVVAARLIALLAWSAAEQGDRIGGVVYAGEYALAVKPQAQQRGVLTLLRTLVEVAAKPCTQPALLARHIMHLAKVARTGTAIFIMNDIWAWDDESLSALARLARGHQVYLVTVYDELEKNPPDPAEYWALSHGKRVKMPAYDKAWRLQYQHSFVARLEKLQEKCRVYRVHQQCLSTQENLANVLKQWRN